MNNTSWKGPLAFLAIFVCQSTLAGGLEVSERLKFDNSFRIRSEYKDTKKDENSPNFRQRMRARLGVNFQYNEQLDARFGLSTAGGKRNSGNQTMGDGFASEAPGIDQAYVRYKPCDGFHLTLGKSKSIFSKPFSTEMLFDGDLRPEGFSTVFEKKFGEWSGGFNAGHYNLVERETSGAGTSSDDTYLGAAQLTAKGPVGPVKLHVGAGLFDFSNLKGNELITNAGNSNTTVGGKNLYSENYSILKAYLSVGMKVLNQKLTFFYDMAQNQKADKNNEASAYGLGFGNGDEDFPFSVGAFFMEMEKDSVVAGLQNSNFNFGNTGGKGLQYWVKYRVNSNSSLRARVFDTETISTADPKRQVVQLDFAFKL